MDRAWAPIIFGGGLLLGFAAGFFLQDLRMDAGIIEVPAPSLFETPPPGGKVEQLGAANTRVLQLDAELAALKAAHMKQGDALNKERQDVGRLLRQLESMGAERGRLRDQTARLERALQEAGTTRLTASAVRDNSAPTVEPTPRAKTVQIVQIDASQQVIALNLGAPDGLVAGSRWELSADDGPSVRIEITESRAGFAIARRTDLESPSALGLARGRAYVIRPLP